jgi:indole-3-glycerol phosphate synthase
MRLEMEIKKCKKIKNPVIAEIKVHSPKHGDLLRGRNPFHILDAYERAGAVGISYITEQKYFKGSFKLFKEICSKTDLPVLRKDFIRTKDEVARTAEVEASAILLIARELKSKTPEFADYALEHGLDPLIEVHNESELQYALESKGMVGINNRDITKLEKDDGNVTITEKVAPLIPDDRVTVSESGITSVRELEVALTHADAVLVGTAFMMADNVEEFVRSFVQFGRR